MLRTRVRTLTALFALACTPTLAAAQSKVQDEADLREIHAYRLTMDNVRKVADVMRTVAEEARKDPRFQELGRVNSELKALQEKEEPTEADQKRIEQLEARQAELEAATEKSSDKSSATLSDMEAEIKAEPIYAAGLAKAGMSARELATFMMAMLEASFAAGMQKSGMLKELPPSVNAENVKFVREHEAELQQLQQEMKGLDPGK